MLRFGIISAVDADKGLAKVTFKEDGMTTDWLPILQKNTKANKHSHTYDIDEHVACLMDEHAENGCIMGAIYSKNETPGTIKGEDVEGVEFSDGTKVSYNRSTSELKIDCAGDVVVICQNASIEASTKVTIDAPDLEITGDVSVGGKIDAVDNITSSGGDVLAGLIGLTTHKHSGVTTGGGVSGTPIP